MPEITAYRLEQAEKALEKHSAELKTIPHLEEKMNFLQVTMDEVKGEVRGLRNTAIGVAASVTGASIIFALTLFFAL